MADSPIISYVSEPGRTVIEVLERNIAPGHETIIDAPVPQMGKITQIISVLESGSATATDPGLYYASPVTAPKADSVKAPSGISGGPTVYSEVVNTSYGRPGWDRKFRLLSGVNSGSDNVVRTRIHIEVE